MATVSGQLTIGSTGELRFDIGIAATRVWFYGLQSLGFADSGNQFVFNSRSNGQYYNDKVVRIYDSSGVLKVSASFVEMDGTELVLNATSANSSYPIQIVADDMA